MWMPVLMTGKENPMNSQKTDNNESVLACHPEAIDADQQEQHIHTARQVFAAVLERQELPDGYSFRLSEEQTSLLQIAAYLSNDRRCCPFFHYTLDLEPHAGAVWLKIRGPEGVKEGILESLEHLASEEPAGQVLAWAAGWQPPQQ
jgi:hypothetical protein